jgi:fumarate reductase flavoprotein subunit
MERGVFMKLKKRENTLDIDVVVIGSGGSGLAAAVEAAERGARVIVIEKQRKAGGATPYGEGIVAAESPTQKRMNIEVTRDQLFKHHMDYTQWTINARLVRALIDKSGETVDWLEKKGLSFNLRGLARPDAPPKNSYPSVINSLPVFHCPPNWGMGIIQTLLKSCRELGVQISYQTKAEKLLTDKNGAVTGLVVSKDGLETAATKK